MKVVLVIHFKHQIKIFQIFFNRLITNRTPIQFKQFTLSVITKFSIVGYYFFENISLRSFSKAFLQKSTKPSNLPIISYNACSLFSASSSGAFVVKFLGLRVRNSLFHVEIICGCIPIAL